MKYSTLILLITTLTLPFKATAEDSTRTEDRFAKVQIKTITVQGNISMLVGQGGNIGVSSGSDGLLMIDDQFAPLAGKIRTALKNLGSATPAYLLNTHYHGDHMGGNAEFGANSLIIAHKNVRLRLINGKSKVPAKALPVITYQQQASVFFNGEEIKLVHFPKGHTDGDTVVFFTQSNVVHMGDHFFKDRFPYVDLDAGGSIEGITSNVKDILQMIDKNTKVIPGHGSLAERKDLQRYHNMLVKTADIVLKQISSGQSEEKILQQGLGSKWKSWGTGFINEDRWIKTLYRDLLSQRPGQ